MKTKRVSLLVILVFFLFHIGYSTQNPDSTEIVKIDTSSTDSVEYELIVFDLGYETYLISQPPMEFYSESYYKTWNIQYVTEWNLRYHSQARTGLYETYIDYDPLIEYGIELEYRLYYYFRFFEKENNVILIQRGK